jgi:GNAT superfamily N-acetyltransferase
MVIRYYTVNNITEFVKSDQFLSLKQIPVSKHRAVSQAHNPRASGEDKILFVAYENNEVAGYIGVVPDMMVHRDAWQKIGWLSCFWVDPEYRGKNIAQSLFSRVMEEWENRIVMTNMAPRIIAFYQRTDLFCEPLNKQGIRGYLRFNLSSVLPPKKDLFKKVLPVLKVLDLTGNILNSTRLFFYPRFNMHRTIRAEYKSKITPEAEQFIAAFNNDEFTRREQSVLEWILNWPWILEGYDDYDSRRYYFSSVAKRFLNQPVQFYDEQNRFTAFIILTVRNENLTVPYYYGQEGVQRDIVKFLINYMRDHKLDMITIFHPELSQALNNLRSPLLFKKKIKRPYMSHKALDISGLKFQDGDGDSAFT